VRDRIRAALEGPGRVAYLAVGAVLGAAALFGLWALLHYVVLPTGMPAGVILLGVVFGSLQALSAIGIVLVYRANRVVNFAQAELGSVAAILAIEFVLKYHFNYFLAIACGLAIAAATGVIIDLLVIRVFHRAPRLILAVATIGVAQILLGLSIQIPLWMAGGEQQAGAFTTPFKARFSVPGVIFNANHVMAMLAVPVVAAALVYFLRYTDYGIAIRAAAENGDRANLLGIPVRRLSTVVWGIAGLLSAVMVILRVPIVGFVSTTSISGGGFFLLMRTLAAAVIGRMESLPVTAGAAIGLAIFDQVAFFNFPNAAIVDVMLVAVILLALLLQRGFFHRAAETGISTWRALREVRPIPTELRGLPEVRYGKLALGGALLLFAVLFPLWATPSREQLAGLVLIYAIVAVSLVVLTGWAGQISLGQFALVGFGGATTSVLLGRHGWDLFLALPVGMLVAAATAVLIGLPALRVSGPFLAVTTLAFAVTASTYFLEDKYFPWFIEVHLDRPALWGRLPIEQDWQMYFFALAVLLVSIIGVRNLRRTRTGRAILAVRDNEPAAQATGLSSVRLKLTAFAISGALAGLAGGLYVLHQHGLNRDSFNPQVSLRLFSMVVIGGLGSIPGAVLGAVYVRGAEFFLSRGWSQIASGGGILLLLILLPGGLGEGVYRVRDWLLRKIAARHNLVVPSLVADVLVTEDEAALALGDALGLSANGERERTGVEVVKA
jgi:branched-chain amino acid transport system permease protein